MKISRRRGEFEIIPEHRATVLRSGAADVEVERATFDAIARADVAHSFQRAGRHRRDGHRFNNTWWVVIAVAVILGAVDIAVVVW